MSLAALGLSAAILTQAPADPNLRPREGRFSVEAPLPTLPAVRLDVDGNGVGVAQQLARAKNVQARILWIDATANLERVNTREKIQALVAKIKSVGFNTIVFDVKPIVGYTLYPSKLTRKLTTWRGKNLPLDFDPLAVFVEVCRREGMPLYVSLNAFSEGHRNAKQGESEKPNPFMAPGPGFERPDLQSILYELDIRLGSPFGGESFPVMPRPNEMPRNGDALGVFTGGAPANPPANSYAVVVNSQGNIVAEGQPGTWNFPGIPQGGGLYLGTAKAGEFLRNLAARTRQLRLISQPVFVRTSERLEQQIPLMMNPHHPEVVSRSLAFVEELARNYAVNGIMFDDRLRYAGLNGDFSPEARAKFEALVGEKVAWPQDIFEFVPGFDLSEGIRPGRYYDLWFSFRAQTMRDFVIAAGDTARRTRPGTQLGIYAGSWYGEYNRYGANWGSQKLQAGFSYLNDNYRKTGFAGHIDFLITGAYYNIATMTEALNRNLPAGRTVESAGQLTNRVVRDETWSYAGIELMKFKGRPRPLMDALQAATGSTQGVMVFDLSHDIEEFWPVFERAFRQRKKAPHAVPGLLEEVRSRRQALDEAGVIDPPVIIREGAAGTGL